LLLAPGLIGQIPESFALAPGAIGVIPEPRLLA
jgi:hypothetical protein